MTAPWSGDWVTSRLHLEIEDDPSSLLPVTTMVGLALRRNPKRPHLLVSKVLGKHVPTDPRIVYGAGRLLGRAVAEHLAGSGADIAAESRRFARALAGAEPVDAGLVEVPGGDQPTVASCLVLGYAETATALGHSVADSLGARYLHTTRRPVRGFDPVGCFDEEHSHAVRHLLLPDDPAMLAGPGPLVLVDDELSTGKTVENTITALHAIRPRDRYVVATLLDARTGADRNKLDAFASRLGARIDVVALTRARITVPRSAADRGREIVAQAEQQAPQRNRIGLGEIVRRDVHWPTQVRETGRHGFGAEDRAGAFGATRRLAAGLATDLAGDDVLVLGFEELMYTPLLTALALADTVGPQTTVRYSTTTRSPVLAVDDPAYAIRTALTFPAHDDPSDGPGIRFAYNAAPVEGAGRFSDIVLIVDAPAETDHLHGREGLLDQLATCAHRVHLVTLPTHRPERSRQGGLT